MSGLQQSPMELHILLAGVEFGPYTDEQARDLLGEGFLSETDPAKRLDETAWLPLNEVLAQPRAVVTTAHEQPETEAPAEHEEPESFSATSSPEDEPVAEEPPPVFEWPSFSSPETNAAPEISAPPIVEETELATEPSPGFFSATEIPSSPERSEEPARPEPQPRASQRIFEPSKPSASSRVRRELTEAEKTSFLKHLTKALPPAPDAPTPVAVAPTPTPPAPVAAKPIPTAAPAPAKAKSSPMAPTAPPMATRTSAFITSPILTTSPLIQSSITAKAKKTRTGALLAQESLRAAREQRGILAPSGTSSLAPMTPPLEPNLRSKSPPLSSPTESTADSAAPASPKKSPVVLRGREETSTPPASQPTPATPATRAPSAPPLPSPSISQTAPIPPSNPATTQRKAIRLTGRITLPGLAPKPDLPQSQAPSLSGPLMVSRPARTGVTSKIQPTRPFTSRDKAPVLSGEIARPADVARQETAAAISAAPALEEKKAEEISAPAPEENREPLNPLVKAAGEETVAEEAAATGVAMGSVAALLEIAGTETVAESSESSTGSGALPAIEEAPAEDDLSASGRLASTGELAERRSLKITGPLRHPTPRLPIRLSSPSKPDDSSRLPYPASAIPMPEAPTEPPPLPPASEESLGHRPASGKIPVSAMPSEGIRIRTRRITGKVPLPDKVPAPEKERAPEPLSARATAPRPLPEAPAEAVIPAAEPKALSLTPPRLAPDLPSQETSIIPGSAATIEAIAPAAEEAATELRDASPAVPVESPGVPTPDKVRLRRPVKLELSSRSKAQETGRLSLEAFSKMASIDLPAKGTPTAVAAETGKATLVENSAASSAPASEPVSPVEPTATPAAADFEHPRLEEAPPLVWKSGLPKTKWRWEWLAYAIITVGVVAVCAIVYIVAHRSHTAEAAATSASTTNEPTASNETSAPPTSAAPPENSSVPPSSAAAPTPAPATTSTATTPAPAPATTPPAPVATPPASNPPVTSTVQDLSRQVDAYVTDGISKYQGGDLTGALAADNQALNLDPKSAPALYNRGIVKAAQNDLDGAVADYSSALQINPNMALAYYYRGLARHSKGELDGAIADYNQAVQIDPKNALAFFNRGLIRMQKDDIDGSIVDSTRALELDPSLIQSYYDRGLGRLAKGSLDSALGDIKTFCQLAPQDAYTDYARLYIWLIQSQQGHLAEANQDLSKAMNNGWNGAADSMVTRIGEFLLGQISEEELLKASTSTIPLKDQGQRCEDWYFIGMRQLQAGNKQAAIEDLQKCVDTQKTDYCEFILAQEQLKNMSSTGDTVTPPRAQPVTLPDPGTMAPNTAPSDAAPVEK
jgi:tetratricopeptide (TPR) repeat protein